MLPTMADRQLSSRGLVPGRTGLPRRLGTALHLSLEHQDQIVFLSTGDCLHLLEAEGEWCRVQTASGHRGYVRATEIKWSEGSGCK